jgi:preprotein translocase subunit Sss1
MRRLAILALTLAAILVVVSVASAQRKPTLKEHAQIAGVVDLPVNCSRVRVSTVTRKPKWGSVSFRDGSSDCLPLASNGVTVAKKSRGRWRSVTVGSSFTCAELYAKVPRAVAKDLKVHCD